MCSKVSIFTIKDNKRICNFNNRNKNTTIVDIFYGIKKFGFLMPSQLFALKIIYLYAYLTNRNLHIRERANKHQRHVFYIYLYETEAEPIYDCWYKNMFNIKLNKYKISCCLINAFQASY